MAHRNFDTNRMLNTDPRGESKGTYKMGKSTGKDLGYAQKGAFKRQTPKADPSKRPSYREAKGAKGTKQWSYGELTADEREDYKVKHGIAPTAADPSKYGVAQRAKDKAIKARGEFTQRELKAQEVTQTREIDKAKYESGIKAAGFARQKAAARAKTAAARKHYSAGGKRMSETSSRSISSLGRTASSNRGMSSNLKSMSNFGFANTGSIGFSTTSGRPTMTR